MRKPKQLLITLAIFALSFAMLLPMSAEAAGKVKLSATRKTITTGQSCTISLKNNKRKVRWSATNSRIKIIKKTKAYAKIKGMKKGTVYLKAKVGGKTYKCRVTVETPSISKKNITLVSGSKYALKVKGTTQKIKWSSSNRSVATVSSKGQVTAKNAGTATISAKVLNKTLKCKVTVKKKEPALGSRTKPLSAYNAHTTDIYDYGDYVGKFRIQLLDYKDGEEAYNYVMKNDSNTEPTESQEYIYVKFKIDYISGSKQVGASDVINHYSNFFNAQSNYELDNIDWGFSFEDVDDMVNVSLYPGGSAICSKAILIKKGHTPITYRLETGYDKNNYEKTYTWFTTKK